MDILNAVSQVYGEGGIECFTSLEAPAGAFPFTAGTPCVGLPIVRSGTVQVWL